MANIPMVEVESSQIHSIGHDPITNTLAIRFYRGFGRGREVGPLYHYQNVSPDDFAAFRDAAFRDAESKGRHFGRFIKPFAHKYPYQKIADEQQAA